MKTEYNGFKVFRVTQQPNIASRIVFIRLHEFQHILYNTIQKYILQWVTQQYWYFKRCFVVSFELLLQQEKINLSNSINSTLHLCNLSNMSVHETISSMSNFGLQGFDSLKILFYLSVFSE